LNDISFTSNLNFFENPDWQVANGIQRQKQPCGVFPQKSTKEKPQRLLPHKEII
jgi:hypothetical protein